MRCTAVQGVLKVGFDWIFEIRVGKLMHITCVFNAFSTRIRQRQIDGGVFRRGRLILYTRRRLNIDVHPQLRRPRLKRRVRRLQVDV